MKDWTLEEMRKLFLDFMKSKGYKVEEPDSLLSPAFSSTFTISGGPNFTDQYLAKKGGRFLGNSAVIQRCFRHWDVDSVGDGKHLSFFEMAVTNCFDGYPREEMLKHHYQFITEKLGLDKNRLYATVFAGGDIHGTHFPADDEGARLLEKIGFPKSRVVKLNGIDAFVANTVESVGGPRMEIFYETGKRGECKPDCIPGLCECGKFIEFWTHVVYNSYVRYDEGMQSFEFKPIHERALAAGFGCERVATILGQKVSIMDIDDVSLLTDAILGLLQEKGVTIDEEIRRKASIAAEHMRGAVFLVFDGAADLERKGNRSKIYLYRKYMRKLFGHLEAIMLEEDGDLRKLIDKTIEIYRSRYPGLIEKKSEIERKIIIRKEHSAI